MKSVVRVQREEENHTLHMYITISCVYIIISCVYIIMYNYAQYGSTPISTDQLSDVTNDVTLGTIRAFPCIDPCSATCF